MLLQTWSQVLTYSFQSLWAGVVAFVPNLIVSIIIFVVGWVFQFVGHFYEKKKPAFMDDVIGLAIGPLFVLAEMVFMLGFRKDIEQRMLDAARKQRATMDNKHVSVISP